MWVENRGKEKGEASKKEMAYRKQKTEFGS
jgi:hypothetical protein